MAAARRQAETPPDAESVAEGEGPASKPGVRLLKKYPNRRLYDTQTSSYITLHDVKRMVLDAQSFEVRDAKTGEDLTRSILLQIILEEETGGVPLFSSQMLAQIIRFYGHAMQGAMGSYLERNLQMVSDLQASWADQAKHMAQPVVPTAEMWQQFMAGQNPMTGLNPMMPGVMGNVFEQSQKMFAQMQENMAKQAAMFPGFDLNRRKSEDE